MRLMSCFHVLFSSHGTLLDVDYAAVTISSAYKYITPRDRLIAVKPKRIQHMYCTSLLLYIYNSWYGLFTPTVFPSLSQGMRTTAGACLYMLPWKAQYYNNNGVFIYVGSFCNVSRIMRVISLANCILFL
jgi:hypothetical protein